MLANDKKERAKDTGMALVLILLLAGKAWPGNYLFPAAVVALLLNMSCPQVFYQPSRLWFGFSNLLGGFVSRLLLSVIFFGLVTPIGLLRRLLGADPMQRQTWKAGSGSVFADRSHLYTGDDLEKPF